MAEQKKIKTICIDTLTAIQENQYTADSRKPGHDKWFDYGITIHRFMNQLQELGFECVLILGEPGTGKSFGMKTLEAGTNIWYNADNKNATWLGGSAEYGKKHNPKEPFHVVPKSYDDIINHLKGGVAAGMFAEEKVAFITGHTETYKSGTETRVRLKTLGKLANKMQIEGKLEVVLYSRVEKSDAGEREFVLHTQNDGSNTARSSEGMLEDKIPNDYNLILTKINEY